MLHAIIQQTSAKWKSLIYMPAGIGREDRFIDFTIIISNIVDEMDNSKRVIRQ